MEAQVDELGRRLIERVKQRAGIETDAELARRFGVNAMQIHRIRTGELSQIAQLVIRMLSEGEEAVSA